MNTHNTTSSPIRAYGKSELAHLYYGIPVSDARARDWFVRELHRYPDLMQELQQLGYSPTNRVFSPQQVRAIFDAIGCPKM